MAFKHVQSNRYVFLLSTEGTPSGVEIEGEDIPQGSLCIDRTRGELFILRPNGFWDKFGNLSESTPIIENLTFNSSNIYQLQYMVEPNTLSLYINGTKAIENADYEFNPVLNRIVWYGKAAPNDDPINNPRYDLEAGDFIEAHYSTKDV